MVSSKDNPTGVSQVVITTESKPVYLGVGSKPPGDVYALCTQLGSVIAPKPLFMFFNSKGIHFHAPCAMASAFSRKVSSYHS
jgi:hypothetical protein